MTKTIHCSTVVSNVYSPGTQLQNNENYIMQKDEAYVRPLNANLITNNVYTYQFFNLWCLLTVSIKTTHLWENCNGWQIILPYFQI